MRWNKFYISVLAVLSVLFSGLFITLENSYASGVAQNPPTGNLIETVDYSGCFYFENNGSYFDMYPITYSSNFDYDQYSYCFSDVHTDIDYYLINIKAPTLNSYPLQILHDFSPPSDSLMFSTMFVNAEFGIHSYFFASEFTFDCDFLWYDYSFMEVLFPLQFFDDNITFEVSYYTYSSSSGSLSITENGTYDVTNYSEVVVNVPVEVNSDTVSAINGVQQAVITGVATLLVLYFFYCIYRLIIRNSGVK